MSKGLIMVMYLICVNSTCVSRCPGVYLWVLGQSEVAWSEKPGEQMTNMEYEIYMKDCLILWGRGECRSLGTIKNVISL